MVDVNTHAKFQTVKHSVAMCFFLRRDVGVTVAMGCNPRIVNILKKYFYHETSRMVVTSVCPYKINTI